MFQKSLLLLSFFVAALTSCQKSAPKADLNTAADSLLYALGVSQSTDQKTLAQFLERVGADKTAVTELVAGIVTGIDKGYDAIDKVKDTDDKKDKAYYAGIMQGVEYASLLDRINAQLLDSAGVKANRDNFAAGFADHLYSRVQLQYQGKPLTAETAQQLVQEIGMRLEEPRLLKQYGNIKAAGEQYISAKKKEAGIEALPSGVLYRTLTAGQGAKPQATDKVAVRYVGKLTDGTVFDATSEHGTAADTFAVGAVIPGWKEALQHMPVGSKWEVVIPYRQAYGTRHAGKIPPFSTLIFEVELLGIVKK